MRSLRQVHGMIKLACAASLLVVGPALGASYVYFTVELGGNNRSALWHTVLRPTPFADAKFLPGTITPSSPVQSFLKGADVTWDLTVTAGGTQSAGNGAGLPIWGAANLVCNLELYKDTVGNLATSVVWKSTMNDGQPIGSTGYNARLANAAFAASYNVALNGPGRVIDPYSDPTWPRGGPFMGGPGWPQSGGKDPKNARTYPTAEPGKLVGMGCGYYAWYGSAAGVLNTKPGVGMTTLPNSLAGLGVVPVMEGQMDTTAMALGTYILKVIPGAGINVLRGDPVGPVSPPTDPNNPYMDPQNAFATAVEQTTNPAAPNTTETITFVLVDPPMPGMASNPSPADQATDLPLNTSLTWTAGSDATSEDVYFDTANPPTQLATTVTTPGYTPPGLQLGITYYWQIKSKNLKGTTDGPVWSFTTASAPGKATAPVPATASTNVPLDQVLSWTAGSNTTSHDVYFGTSNPPSLIGNQAGTSYTPPTLANSQTYYWRIDEVGPGGTTTGDVWSFTTVAPVPGKAINPTPANLAVSVPLEQVLSWTAGGNTTSHDVYFGTTNPPSLIGNQAGTTYTPAGGLAYGQTYYWRIDEVGSGGTTTGDVWSFSTPAPLVAISWRLLKTHAGVGEVAVQLDPSDTSGGTAEPRADAALSLVIEFNHDCDLTAWPSIVGSDSSVVTPDTFEYVGTNGMKYVFLPGTLLNGVCYTIDVAGTIVAVDGTGLEVSGDTTCKVRILYGDGNGNGTVNLGDVIFAKAKLGTATADNARFDVDLSGSVTLTDVAAVKAQMGAAAASCP